MNKVILIGRLTRDPEIRHTQSGLVVGSFTLAVDRNFTGADGKKETDFINIVAWRKLAEVCANHLGKGRLVAVEGRLQIRGYEDKDGNKRKAAEVVANEVKFLDYGKDRAQGGQGGSSGSSANDFGGSEVGFSEEEIPF